MDGSRLSTHAAFYWRLGLDLRLTRLSGADDADAVEEIADFAQFTDFPQIRTRCLSLLRCDVTPAQGTHG